MRVVEIGEPGGPESLRVAQRPDPTPAAGQILVRVAAAGLNRADLMQRRGKYPAPPGAPEWPGLEISGVVESVGADVREFAAGDRVCALLSGGGYADLCVVPVEQALPVPATLDFIQAAALPEACFTVWSNVFEFCSLSPGESLLVHGGTSGIGSIAIQIAVARGHQVFTTAGSAAKCSACESFGAARAINYRDEDFVEAILAATSGRGVDVVLDMIGGDYIARDIACMAEEGRIAVIATQRGAHAPVDLARIMQRRVILTGSMLRSRPVGFKGQIKTLLLEHVWPLIERGAVKAVVDRTFPLASAAAAHAYMERGEHIGKIILTC